MDIDRSRLVYIYIYIYIYTREEGPRGRARQPERNIKTEAQILERICRKGPGRRDRQLEVTEKQIKSESTKLQEGQRMREMEIENFRKNRQGGPVNPKEKQGNIRSRKQMWQKGPRRRARQLENTISERPAKAGPPNWKDEMHAEEREARLGSQEHKK